MTAATGLAGAEADAEPADARLGDPAIGGEGAGVTIEGRAVEPRTGPTRNDLGYADELADALIATLKQVGAIKARAAAPVDHDLTQIFLLVRLAEAGPIRATELAGLVCADPSTVSRHVAALVKAGFIQRTSDPADGRASLLVATQAGRDHVHAQRRIRGASIAPLVIDWSEQDRTDFLRLLRRFTRELDAHRDDLLAAFQARRTDGSN